MRSPLGLLALGAALIAGCAIEHASPRDPAALIPDRSAEVALGKMDRAAVRAALGSQRLSSDYWRFDLFRADSEHTATVFAVTPWPIPFARLTDQLQRFTLVAYGVDGQAAAVASGLFRRPTSWRNTSPIAHDHPSLHLRAGELMFFLDPEGARDVNLLAAPRRRDAFLADARDFGGCTVVLGCGARGCGDQLSVDGGAPRRLPLRTAHAYWLKADDRAAWLEGTEPHAGDPRAPWLEALVALRLAAGEHGLEFSARYLGGSSSMTFACRAGEVAYLVIDAASNESFWRPALVDWRIERSAAMPAPFARRPLVLMDDGQWQVEAEPGR
ncbi:MAG TPA: hypothetical protein VF876_05050 [Burkholderiales bacterium]